jgi:ABC-type lipoprotein release transport system permease subunit
MNRHLKILEFALFTLLRHKIKNVTVVLVYTFVVFTLASVLFFSQALKKEASLLFDSAPELIVQRVSAGRHGWIPLDYCRVIEKIRGVKSVTPRFWGYYYDPPTRANYTFMGKDNIPSEVQSMVKGRFFTRKEPWGCIIGQGIAEARMLEPDDIIPIKGGDGNLYALRVKGIFQSSSQLLTNDLVVMAVEDWRKIFNIPAGAATDLVTRIPNTMEIDTVVSKIQEHLPDARPISREQILKTYDALFDWRSGVMIVAFAGCLAAFAILAFDRAAGLSADERHAVGVLKALGWEVSHILELKFWEGFCISMICFLTGVITAHVHVFYFGGTVFAPMLKGWSVLFPKFQLTPHAEMFLIVVVWFLSVLPYMLATIVPSWKMAITDPDMVMRG